MKTIKSFILSAFVASIIFGCGSTASILSTPVENIDNTPLKASDLTEKEKRTWGHLDLVKDTIPGMSVDKAYTEIIKTKKNTILLDAYNANPTSMISALENFNALTAAHKTVILGDMFELGKNSVIEHQNIVDFAASHNFDNCYFVGELFFNCSNNDKAFKTFEDFSTYLFAHKITRHFILIKGSRGMALERILKIID